MGKKLYTSNYVIDHFTGHKSLNRVRIINFRRLRRAGHVSRMGETMDA
jgi:hypothetical protein